MRVRPQKLVEYAAMLFIWLALVLLFGLLSRNFLSLSTFAILANRIPPLTVISAGMTLVLIVGGIDLSVGSLSGLCGCVLGVALATYHVPFAGAVALAVMIGLIAGTLNGVLSVCLGIPSFIVTLGMFEIARGLAYLTTGSQTKYIGAAVEGLSAPIHGIGISPAFLAAVLIILIGQVILSRTVFGRYLMAIGANEIAVRFSGIDPKPRKIAVFALLGFAERIGRDFLHIEAGIGGSECRRRNGTICDCGSCDRRNEFDGRTGFGCKFVFWRLDHCDPGSGVGADWSF